METCLWQEASAGLPVVALRHLEEIFFKELVLSQIRSHTFQIDGGHKAFAAVLPLHLRPAVFVALDFFHLLFSDEVDKPFVF